MLYYYLLFFFVSVGAKLLLALVMIYLLLPTDRRCSDCNGETLLLENNWLVRTVTRFTPGRLQRRWCPRCGDEGFARPPIGARTPNRPAGDRIPIRVHDVDHE